MITGSPVYVDKKLLVPVSSLESGTAANPLYNCCTFRGSLVALEGKSGKEIWRFYTITDVAKVVGENALGVDIYGPSGAAIWSAPTVDI